MFLFRRGKYYHLYYHDKNGKRKNLSTRTKSKHEALKFLTKFEKELKKRKEQETLPIILKDFRWKLLKRLELTHADNFKRTSYIANYHPQIHLFQSHD